MALRQLILRKKIEAAKAQLETLRAKDADFLTRKTELETREAELEAAVNEVTDETPDADKAAVEESVTAFETDKKTYDEEQAGHDTAKSDLETEIQGLEAELKDLDERSKPKPAAAPTPAADQRKDNKHMENRKRFFGMDREERSRFFARDDVKGFIDNFRAIKTRGVTNGDLTVPEVMMEVLRDNMEQYSKLIKYVTVKQVKGKARQNILGAVPEGVWMEATGALNELDMTLNQIEVDGFMVGGIIWIHNTLLEDSDMALGSEIMVQLAQAAGKGVDRGILYGTGSKMPLGIVPRLAQTSEPSDWGDYAPTWTDLHTSNIKKLNISGSTGATFYAALIAALGVAKTNYSNGECFWVMNRKTHIDLMAKALAFDAAAALVAGVKNQMPIVGGDIVELEMVGDYEIVGGFGSVYTLVEREGSKIESSSHAKFKENLTGFKGYARYDGQPVFGEAFVVVSYDNSDAATSSTFPTDYANTDLGALTVTSVAGTASGDSLVTVGGAESSGTTLGYKIGGKAADVKSGDTNTGYDTLTSPAQVTVATGKIITVVEFDGNGRAIKVGSAQTVAKA